MKKNLEKILNFGKNFTLVTLIGASSLLSSCTIDLIPFKTKNDGGKIYYQAEFGGGINLADYKLKLSDKRTSFYGDQKPSYSEEVNLNNILNNVNVLVGSPSKESLYCLNLKLENSIGSDLLRIGLGASFDYYLGKDYEESIKKQWETTYYPYNCSAPGFAHEVTGYDAMPWDVHFFAGMPPVYTINPFANVQIKMLNINATSLKIVAGMGLPFSKFKWRKFYVEQLNPDRFTMIEKADISSFGKSFNFGLYLEVPGKSPLDEYEFGIDFSRAVYPIEILGEKNSIKTYTISFKFIIDF